MNRKIEHHRRGSDRRGFDLMWLESDAGDAASWSPRRRLRETAQFLSALDDG
jgi:hypothetical protein